MVRRHSTLILKAHPTWPPPPPRGHGRSRLAPLSLSLSVCHDARIVIGMMPNHALERAAAH